MKDYNVEEKAELFIDTYIKLLNEKSPGFNFEKVNGKIVCNFKIIPDEEFHIDLPEKKGSP